MAAAADQVLLAPPFIVTPADVEAIVETLAAAIDETLMQVGAA